MEFYGISVESWDGMQEEIGDLTLHNLWIMAGFLWLLQMGGQAESKRLGTAKFTCFCGQILRPEQVWNSGLCVEAYSEYGTQKRQEMMEPLKHGPTNEKKLKASEP